MITIAIFIPCWFIGCQSYNDIKGLIVCMFFDYIHIDYIDYNEMYAYPLYQKGFFTFLSLPIGHYVLGGNTTLL